MFKGFQDTSALQQFHGFPNLNMQQATSAYGFSGVTFWLDAAYGLNTQTNGATVSSWQARVGGTFLQPTAGNQPFLILNDANFNNLPTVSSGDTNRFMDLITGTALIVNPQITIVAISKVNTTQGANAIIGTIQGSSGAGLNDGGTNGAYNGFGLWSAIGTNIIQGTTESANARIKVLTSTNIIVNGNIETTGSLTNAVFNLNRLFRHTSTQSSISTTAEIIAFGYSMTSDEAIALSNNINQKYALY